MVVCGAVFAAPGEILWVSAAAVGLLMLIVWALSVPLHDVSIVDVAWGPAFVLVAAVAVIAGLGDAPRRWLLCGLTAMWGLRLGVHLLRRKLAEPGEDQRYRTMRTRRPTRFVLWSLGMVFAAQTSLILAVSLPLQVAADRPAPMSAAIVPGVILFAVGWGFEAVGDEQLRRFKADRSSVGVMDRGLWRYTRHPNYFGDACVWWGLWLVVLPAGGTWWTVVGPLVMTVLLVRVSGKKLLERDIGQRRPGYADYVRRTSGFIPMPPRGRNR